MEDQNDNYEWESLKYYFSEDKKKHGPLKLDELTAEFLLRGLSGNTLIWFSGLAAWQKLNAVKGLYELVVPTESSPPSPTSGITDSTETEEKDPTSGTMRDEPPDARQPDEEKQEPANATLRKEEEDSISLAFRLYSTKGRGRKSEPLPSRLFKFLDKRKPFTAKIPYYFNLLGSSFVFFLLFLAFAFGQGLGVGPQEFFIFVVSTLLGMACVIWLIIMFKPQEHEDKNEYLRSHYSSNFLSGVKVFVGFLISLFLAGFNIFPSLWTIQEFVLYASLICLWLSIKSFIGLSLLNQAKPVQGGLSKLVSGLMQKGKPLGESGSIQGTSGGRAVAQRDKADSLK